MGDYLIYDNLSLDHVGPDLKRVGADLAFLEWRMKCQY